jgi:type II secretory pathway pseudopilin PulG
MLIVIVVIGILAGIYLLAAEPAIERARATDCVADRATIKREYYMLRAENKYTSDDFAKAVENDLGRTGVGGDGSTFTDVCRDGGTYTCTIDDNGVMTIVCSIHDKTSAGNGLLPAGQVISAMAKNMPEISANVKSELNSTSTKTNDAKLINSVAEILANNDGVNLSGYDWKITPKSSSNTYYYVYITKESVANVASGSTVSVTRYSINKINGNIAKIETGTAKVVWDGTYKKIGTNQGDLRKC